MLAFTALAIAIGADPLQSHTRIGPREDNEEGDKLAKANYNRLLANRGVKEFTIDGVTVFARDYKNAERKVKNRLQTTKQ